MNHIHCRSVFQIGLRLAPSFYAVDESNRIRKEQWPYYVVSLCGIKWIGSLLITLQSHFGLSLSVIILVHTSNQSFERYAKRSSAFSAIPQYIKCLSRLEALHSKETLQAVVIRFINKCMIVPFHPPKFLPAISPCSESFNETANVRLRVDHFEHEELLYYWLPRNLPELDDTNDSDAKVTRTMLPSETALASSKCNDLTSRAASLRLVIYLSAPAACSASISSPASCNVCS